MSDKYYYVEDGYNSARERPRFHKNANCRMVGCLLGFDLKPAAVNSWYETCTCHACGLPLSQPPKVEG